MSYEISDNGVSIHFQKEGKEFLLMKHTIRRISVPREDMIVIGTGECTSGNQFRFSEVVQPVAANINVFLSIINEWIDGYVTPPGER